MLAESNKLWDAAAQEAIREASETLENIRSIYIKDFQPTEVNNQITRYHVNAKISFEIRQ